MAVKLSQLMRAEPQRSAALEVPCGLGCGVVMRDWVQITVMGSDPNPEGVAVHGEGYVPKPTLDLRVCFPCFGIYIYDMTAAHKALMEALGKRA